MRSHLINIFLGEHGVFLIVARLSDVPDLRWSCLRSGVGTAKHVGMTSVFHIRANESSPLAFYNPADASRGRFIESRLGMPRGRIHSLGIARHLAHSPSSHSPTEPRDPLSPQMLPPRPRKIHRKPHGGPICTTLTEQGRHPRIDTARPHHVHPFLSGAPFPCLHGRRRLAPLTLRKLVFQAMSS